MKTVYYYQTFEGLDKLMTHPEDVDIIIVSSIHFGKDGNGTPNIYLNDNLPSDDKFTTLWKETEELSKKNVTITCMMGGAGLAYRVLFDNFDTYYPLLVQMIQTYSWISGIDLDIEEEVDLDNVKMLIDKLNQDFGSDFIISMAPVSSSLENDGVGMGNFSYKTLYNTEQGKRINWFNCQAYNSFSSDTLSKIVANGYPADKIIMGMESAQFTGDEYLPEIRKMKETHPDINGVYDWEYFDAPPECQKDPSEWCKLIKNLN
jgi:hypothetical protein|tara:strand:- start:2407 stop:3189 length:783 start_codon:yes stop_codon:yes gene_type:complete